MKRNELLKKIKIDLFALRRPEVLPAKAESASIKSESSFFHTSAAEALLIAAVSIAAFIYYLIELSSSPEVPGCDGYVYLIQVRSLLENGRLHYRDLSPVYPFMALFRILINSDVAAYKSALAAIGAMKCGAAAFAILCFYGKEASSKESLTHKVSDRSGAAGVLRSGEIILIALLGAILTASDTSALYTLIQFPKNSLAVMFLYLTLAFVMRRRFLPAAVLFIITMISHRICAGFLIIGTFLYLVSSTRVVFLLAFAASAAALAALTSFIMPGMLNIFDFERITSTLSANPVYAPVEFGQLLSIGSNDPYWFIRLHLTLPVIAAALIICIVRPSLGCPLPAAVLSQQNNPQNYSVVKGGGSLPLLFSAKIAAIFFATSLLINFPFLCFTPDSAAFRFFLQSASAAPLAGALCAGAVCFSLRGKVTEKRFLFHTTSAALLAATAVMLLILSSQSYRTKRIDPPYAAYREIALRIAEVVPPRESDLYVAHKMLAEVMDYHLHADVLPWSPEAHFDRKRTWRVVWLIAPFQIEPFVTEDNTLYDINSSYTLVREDLWERFILSAKEDPFYTGILSSWKNPSRLRPAYLSRQR